MAISAVEIAPVVQRFIGQADVLIGMWNPRIGRVALIALAARDEVSVVLAGGGIAIMAGRT